MHSVVDDLDKNNTLRYRSFHAMTSRDRLVRVAPLVLPRMLVDALAATASSMASPMMPTVSTAWAARELVTRGCDVLEALLRAGGPIEWTVAAPPRGHRRAAASTVPSPSEADRFTPLPPIALYESQVKRLTVIRRRLSSATGSKVSSAKTLREALARGFEQRERMCRASEDAARRGQEALLRAGFPDLSQLVVVGSFVATPYAPPGRKRAQRTPSNTPAPSSKARSPRGGNSRAPRKKRRVARRTTTGGDDDDGSAPRGRDDGARDIGAEQAMRARGATS